MIHVLGAGNIGSLIASALGKSTPVTLLLRSQNALQKFRQADSTVQLYTPFLGATPLYTTKLDAECVTDRSEISRLIVTTKVWQARTAIESIAPRLTPDAQIMLVHNGMGVFEEIQPLLPSSIRWSHGVTNAGVKSVGSPYTFALAGHGELSIARRDNHNHNNHNHDNHDNLFEAIQRANTALLATQALSWPEFVAKQYEKLVVNAAINPLTALLGCTNGALQKLDKRHHEIRQVVKESCRIIRKWTAANDPQNGALVARVLDPERMVGVVYSVCESTATNVSSMLADVEQGRRTEIDYINGYITRLARDLDTGAYVNSTLVRLVQMRSRQVRHELAHEYTPLVEAQVQDSSALDSISQ